MQASRSTCIHLSCFGALAREHVFKTRKLRPPLHLLHQLTCSAVKSLCFSPALPGLLNFGKAAVWKVGGQHSLPSCQTIFSPVGDHDSLLPHLQLHHDAH